MPSCSSGQRDVLSVFCMSCMFYVISLVISRNLLQIYLYLHFFFWICCISWYALWWVILLILSFIITPMLGSNKALSNRQQWFPETIISFRTVWEGRYWYWASGGEPQICRLQHWAVLGHTWAGTVHVSSLTFLLLCASLPFHLSKRFIYKKSVLPSIVWGALLSSSCALEWMMKHAGKVIASVLLRTEHLALIWSSYSYSTKHYSLTSLLLLLGC